MEAQTDAIRMICGARSQQNPENTFGLITMAGKTPEVRVTLSNDIGKIYTALHGMKIHGKANLGDSLRIAQLALLHRQSKVQTQKIVLFVGSPLDMSEKELVQLGKRLKKNGIGVDVVNFGELVSNTERLEAFMAAVNKDNNSNLIHV